MAQTLPKKPQILGGIMQALYGMSGVEADPTFEDAASRAEGEAMFGAENLTPKNTTRPYKGSGLFGGVKAKGANNAYAGQDALAENAGQRSLRLLPEQLRIQRESEEKAKEAEAARALKTRIEDENRALKAKIEEENRVKTGKGAAIGNVMGNLPTEQLMALNAPTSFSSPQEQADWYGAAFGDKPVTDAPATAVKSAQDFAFNSDPATLQNRKDVDYNASLMNLGTGKLKRGSEGNPGIVYNDAGSTKKSTITPVATGKKTFNSETGLMENEYKDVIVNTEEPYNAFTNQIEKRQMTQDDLNATKNPNVGDGNSNSPVSKPDYQEAIENPFVTPTTNPNPPTPVPAEVSAKPQAKPLLDNYEGIVPNIVNNNFGLNPIADWYKNNISSPIYQGGKALMESPPQPSIGTGLKQFTDNSGKLFSDIGKNIIRPKGSQFSGIDPIELIRQALQGAGDSAAGMLNKVAVPASETLEGIGAPIRDTLNSAGDTLNKAVKPVGDALNKVADNMRENDANYRKVTSESNTREVAKQKATKQKSAETKVSAKPAPADPNQELFDMFKKYGYGANVRSSATAPEDLQKLAASMAKQLELGPAFNQDGMLEKDLARVLEMLQQFKSTPNVRIR